MVALTLLAAASFFFALNMGGSGMAPAFSVALGAKLVRRRTAVLLFALFLTAGALVLGGFVAKTLGGELVAKGSLDESAVLCVIASAAGALFLANALGVPQSTSWVTVLSIVTVGLHRSSLRSETLLYKLLPAWVVLPLLSFAVTRAIMYFVYPLRGINFRLYEHLTKHTWKLKAVVLASSCYVAFAIGANNVANVVGPLAAAEVIDVVPGFLLAAPVFGIGGAVFASPAQTVGKHIVPIGLFSATICNLVVGSIMLVASWKGIPQSLVQVNVGAVLAVSLGKDGPDRLFEHGTVRKIAALWLVTPIIAAGATWLMLEVVG